MEHLRLIIDESGSMSTISESVYKGAKELVESMCTNGTVHIVRFSTDVDCAKASIKKDEALEQLVPRQCSGTTSLFDAIEGSINHAFDTHDHSKLVTFAVITDGIENSSKSCTLEGVRAAIGRAQAKSWRVVFLGSSGDAVEYANTLGIGRCDALTYGNSPNEASSAMRSLVSSTARHASGGSRDFTQTERQVSMTRGNADPPPLRRVRGVDIQRNGMPGTDQNTEWVSIDPRNGALVPYEHHIASKLSNALDSIRDTDLLEAFVPIEKLDAIVYIKKTGKHVQKTLRGERDVRQTLNGVQHFQIKKGPDGFRVV